MSKYNYNSFQNKVAQYLDTFTKTFTDNSFRLTSLMLFYCDIKENRRKRTDDLISRTIKEYRFINVENFKLDNIPLYTTSKTQNKEIINNLSLDVRESQKGYTLYISSDEEVKVGGLIINFIKPLEDSEKLFIQILQIKEIQVDRGVNNLIRKKVLCTLCDREFLLDETLLNKIQYLFYNETKEVNY